jgi:hypothetical protein
MQMDLRNVGFEDGIVVSCTVANFAAVAVAP